MSEIPHIHRQFAMDAIAELGFFESIQWVGSVDSTNKQLAQRVRGNGVGLPALLVADEQTGGVGRGNNPWWSPTGCLMFSMAIAIEASNEPNSIRSELLPLRVGCAMAGCLENFSTIKPLVKWPNDVYIAGRKVCGVLIEVIPRAAGSAAIAIIGVGINCRVDFRNAPNDIQTIATSLHASAKKDVVASISTESVLVAFLQHWLELEKRHDGDPTWLFECWPERSLLDGQWIDVKHSQGTSQGLCLGINASGAILIQNEQLEVIEVIAGTVQSFKPLER